MPSLTLSIIQLIGKRLGDNWKLISSIFFGIVITTTLSAATPTYLNSLDQVAFETKLDEISDGLLEFNIFASNVAINEDAVESSENTIHQILHSIFLEAFGQSFRYLRTENHIVGLPKAPLGKPGHRGYLVSQGHFHSFTALEDHVDFVQGRMATSHVEPGLDNSTTIIEAVITKPISESLFCNGTCKIKLNDIVTLATDTDTNRRISARIVGILEPENSDSKYWSRISIFANPPPYFGTERISPPGVRVSNLPEPPLPLFINEQIMFDVIGEVYPATFINPIWMVEIDKTGFENLSSNEALNRLEKFESRILTELQGASVTTSNLQGLINNLHSQILFSTLPILLVITIIISTVLFFLATMVSYLTQGRQIDASLLRTRGIGFWGFLKLHFLEGIMMVAVASILAPLISTGAVALAGISPPFEKITGETFLPTKLMPASFLIAATTGILCLAIYLVPCVTTARVGLLASKLQLSRPPTTNVFHRHYIDIALLVLGGLVFWELTSRGHLISGGLFKTIEVNETLLLAPVLFLLAVGLVFMRFFPVVVKFLSAESAALTHLLAGISVSGIVSIAIWNVLIGSKSFQEFIPLALIVGVGVAYWWTNRKERLLSKAVGLIMQTTLIVAFIIERPLQQGSVALGPTIVLCTIVPLQLLYVLLTFLSRTIPIWLKISLVHMSRNPSQYTWVMLLIVLATGLGIVTTTVGGTLQTNKEERILYELPSHLRVRNAPSFLPNPVGLEELKTSQIDAPEVLASALALRTTGSLGAANFQVFGLESESFSKVSWYREDFSSLTLKELMDILQSVTSVQKIRLPDDAVTIGTWIKPVDPYPNLYLWMVLEDSTGTMRTISLGPTGNPGETKWSLLRSEIPPDLTPPLYLASVQIHEPGAQSLALAVPSTGSYGISRLFNSGQQRSLLGSNAEQRRGAILLDHIHVTKNVQDLDKTIGSQEYVVEDFENGKVRWTPIPTFVIGETNGTDNEKLYLQDEIAIQNADVWAGENAAVLLFGYARNKSVRGFFLNVNDGPIPVVISSDLSQATNLEEGSIATGFVAGRITPFFVQSVIERFPTLEGAFIIADIDILLSYLNLFGNPSRLSPNELYISRKDMSLSTEDVLADFKPGLFRVENGHTRLISLTLNPFTSAGWEVIEFVSIVIVLLCAGFGYITYLLLLSKKRRGEMGFLRSLGLSRLQMLKLLGFEHLVIVAIGLSLGTWAGLQMAHMIISPVAITEFGEPVIPPFVLKSDLGLMLPMYAGLFLVFLGSLAILNRDISKVDLTTIQRISDS